jgi:hypothetical protein
VLTRFHVLDESSPKIKAITNSKVEEATYKAAKDALEFYLQESPKNITGTVGTLQIASSIAPSFLNDVYDYYIKSKQQLFLSEPTFALSDNLDGLFKNLFHTYVGRKYQIDDQKDMSIKKYVRHVFEERKLMNNKVAHDIELSPIEEVKSVKINIDFGFKNGVWNYLQAIPIIHGPSKSTEWFAKTKFMIEALDSTPKFYLMYRSSEQMEEKNYLNELITFLSKQHQDRIIGLDLDNNEKLNQLCITIERDAHDIGDVLVS